MFLKIQSGESWAETKTTKNSAGPNWNIRKGNRSVIWIQFLAMIWHSAFVVSQLQWDFCKVTSFNHRCQHWDDKWKRETNQTLLINFTTISILTFWSLNSLKSSLVKLTFFVRPAIRKVLEWTKTQWKIQFLAFERWNSCWI